MCHGNEEWCNFWWEIDLWLQNWHKEFDKFWSKHSKVSKMFTVIGSFTGKNIMFELKNTEELFFMALKSLCKIWREIDFSFQKWHEEFDTFWTEHWKVSKISTLMHSFWAKYKLIELKKYRGITFHDTKVWWKNCKGVDLSFQNSFEQYDKFWPEPLWSLKNLHFHGHFLAKVYKVWVKNVPRSYVW